MITEAVLLSPEYYQLVSKKRLSEIVRVAEAHARCKGEKFFETTKERELYMLGIIEALCIATVRGMK